MTPRSRLKTIIYIVATFLGLKKGLRVSTSFIPTSIRNKLDSMFHPESVPYWNVRPLAFQAILNGNGRSRYVSFNIWGDLKSVITEIELENLPSIIREQLLNNSAGSTFRKVYKIETRQGQYYEVELKKGLMIRRIGFASDGKLTYSTKSNILN